MSDPSHSSEPSRERGFHIPDHDVARERPDFRGQPVDYGAPRDDFGVSRSYSSGVPPRPYHPSASSGGGQPAGGRMEVTEVSGEVHDFSSNTAGQALITTFTLESGDPATGRRASRPVRAFGYEMAGFARNGDQVTVLARPEQGVFQAVTVLNHRTGARLELGKTEQRRKRNYVRLQVVLLGIFLAAGAVLFLVVPRLSKQSDTGTPTVSLSASSGKPNAIVYVSGSGFGKDELVEVDIQTDQCARISADAHGRFSRAACRVPSTYSNFTGTTVEITATGKSTFKYDDQTFTID